MSHTPGPWYVATKQDCDEEGHCGESVYDRGSGVFAVIDGEPETIATPWLEADARLIASAPSMKDEIDRLKAEKAELLEVLEELGNAIDGREDIIVRNLDKAVFVWIGPDFVQKIMAAIKKARGEE